MKDIKLILDGWSKSLCSKVELGGLLARNPTAHKWKATYRCLVLRELTLWRFTDLLSQVVVLEDRAHILGARILLRSAIETMGILIYLNQKMLAVLEKREPFKAFDETTSRLMLGSKNKSTKIEAINVVSVLKQCDKRYPGIFEMYEQLCESAHPNYDGVCYGYSFVNEKKYETNFKNRWKAKYGKYLKDSLLLAIETFEEEYNEVWPQYFEQLETWLEDNDEILESQRKQI